MAVPGRQAAGRPARPTMSAGWRQHHPREVALARPGGTKTVAILGGHVGSRAHTGRADAWRYRYLFRRRTARHGSGRRLPDRLGWGGKCGIGFGPQHQFHGGRRASLEPQLDHGSVKVVASPRNQTLPSHQHHDRQPRMPQRLRRLRVRPVSEKRPFASILVRLLFACQRPELSLRARWRPRRPP
jgi:hypothetical protein